MPVSARLLGRRILAVELDDLRVVVEPGVTNLAVFRAVAPTHFYPPDPSSQIVCSIGGNVPENSGGAHCHKYGFTTNYVIGLELVLTGGEVLRLARDDPGYDLPGAFVGSEGTLGVATRITLRVTPAPEHMLTLVAFFEHTAQAAEAVTAIVSAGIVPGAIEMMDRLSIQAAEAATEDPAEGADVVEETTEVPAEDAPDRESGSAQAVEAATEAPAEGADEAK